MRILPRLNEQFIAISADPTSLTCCFLEHTQRGIKVLGFDVYDGLSTESSVTIFNATKIAHFIQAFKKKHSLRNPRVALSLTGSPVVEAVIALPHTKPPLSDFITREPKLRNTHIAYRYLFSADNNNFMFYVCGMPHYLIFQYQLLARMAGSQLILVTTEFNALMHVHHSMHNTSKRQLDVAPYIKEKPYFKSLMSVQTCVQSVHFAPGLTIDINTHAPSIMKACGLLYAGNI